jgi:hypothetical protein
LVELLSPLLTLNSRYRSESALKPEGEAYPSIKVQMDSLARMSEDRYMAAVQKLNLAKDLALERAKVVEMEKALETKDCDIAVSEDHESYITQRFGEEIMAKERAEGPKYGLAAQLGHILGDTGRKISDLKKQLVMEQSAGTNKLQENDRLAKQLACEGSAKKQLAQKIQELEGELQQKNKELSATQKASKEERERHASLENKIEAELTDRKNMIDELGEANRILHEQIESAQEAHNHLQRSHDAAEKALGMAQQATLEVEKDLQSQRTRRVEEIELVRLAIGQATKAKEEAVKRMISMKENLEKRLSERATLELRLKLECGKMRSQLAKTVQSHQELEDESAHRRDRLSVCLQNALVERDQAAEDYTKSKDHLGALYQGEFQARAQLERRCRGLHLEAVESRKAWAKKEQKMRERETILVRRLHSMEISFRDHIAKCERTEEELRLWKEQDGVIALD